MCKNPAYRFILKITNNTMNKLKQKAPAANAIATMNADEIGMLSTHPFRASLLKFKSFKFIIGNAILQ